MIRNHTVFAANPTRAIEPLEANVLLGFVGWKVRIHNRETGEERRAVITRAWRKVGDWPTVVRVHVVTEGLDLLSIDCASPWCLVWSDEIRDARRALVERALASLRADDYATIQAQWDAFAREVAALRGSAP